MSFQPILPTDGYLGWRFLQRTREAQQAAHANTPATQRDEAYFRERIADINSAEELVADRRLLRVALTAFGLQDDLPNRAYLKKVLESSIYGADSFVNRLADKRYRQFSEAFGFGDRTVPRNKFTGFAESVLTRYRDRSFELAVGQQDESMRVALAMQRDLSDLASKAMSETTRWFTVLGTPNLRAVFEQAYALPKSFGTLDIDRQVDVLRSRTQRLTGADTISQFASPDALEALTKRYFLMGQISQTPAQNGQTAALSLLQTGQAALKGVLGR